MRAQVATALDRHDLSGALTAYDRLRSSDGDDEGLLGRLAEMLLEDEARSADAAHAQAALTELGLAGTAGRATLERLADGGSVPALVALARAGHEPSRRLLRGMADAADPETRAAALLGASPEDDRALLLSRATETSARVRAVACERLGALAPDSEVRLLLEDRARMDPDPAVRSAAASALGAFGEAALPILRERLSDPVASVRMGVVAALLRADRDAARETIASLLATPPSPQGIEGARLLATPVDRDAPPTAADTQAARAYLFGALAASDAALRSQAAIALSTLRLDEAGATHLAQALAREPDAGAKLSIARALLAAPGGEGGALEALHALSTEASMPGLQAAIVLALRHDDAAADAIDRAMHTGDIPLRRTAARALARDAMRPGRAAAAFADGEPLVRIAAAGGILAARAASE
jgi:hypothetical protein